MKKNINFEIIKHNDFVEYEFLRVGRGKGGLVNLTNILINKEKIHKTIYGIES